MASLRSSACLALVVSAVAAVGCSERGAHRVARDGGSVGVDAARMENDGAVVGSDSGADGGAVGFDAGVVRTDAGAMEMDAGRSDAGRDAGTDAGRDAGRDAGFDAGRDAGFDAGRDAGRDAGTDAGRDAGTDAGPRDAGPITSVAVVFPSTVSNTNSGPLGAGGGGVHFVTGDFVEETFPGTGLASITRLDVSFEMDDMTNMFCTVGPLSWNVILNGTIVGTYGYMGGFAMGRFRITQSYTFPAIAGAGAYTIRFEATTTVCPGGSSWNWFAGGTATFSP